MILSSSMGYSQEDKNFPIDFINQIGKYDISHLFMCDSIIRQGDNKQKEKRPESLGFIGENYQRFYIHFISVTKNIDNNNQYLVKGKTRVKQNICDFEGVINIKEARTGNIEWIIDSLENFYTGFIKGTYNFKGNSEQVNSGIFNGEFELSFYYDKTNTINYNALSFGISDNFSNNQFNGTWASYDNKINMICNWGDFRIPNSSNFDIGAGEFSPNEKYRKYGWENYLKEVEKWW